MTSTWAKVWNFVLGLGPRNWLFLLFLQRLVAKVLQDDANYNRLFYLQFFDPLSWRVSYVIYPILVDLGHPFVDHADRYSSACPIYRLPKPSVSCNNQGSTAQGSFPHYCGQIVSCGHLMRRWQLLLELLLHHTPMGLGLCMKWVGVAEFFDPTETYPLKE